MTPPRFAVRLAVVLLGLLGSTRAAAQGFIIDVPGGREVKIAVPTPTLPAGDPERMAGVVHETLLKDIQLSGYFTVIDTAATIDRSGGVEPGSFDLADWKAVDAAVLVKTRILPTGDATCDPTGKKMCADAYVYYVVNGDTLLTKRFRAESKAARYIGHEMANEIVRAITGREAFFDARISAVSSQGGNKEIVLLDLDGKGQVPVTRNGSINLSPAWSADGRSIAWTSYKKSNPDLYVKDLGSGRTRVISNLLGINTSPAFHPSGKSIAMVRSNGGDSDIYVVDAFTGKVLEQMTKGGGIDVSPNWSPDGRRLAFASERSGGSQVYVLDTGTKEATRVTFNGDFNTDPVFSPDGTKLAFVGRSEGGFDVYVCDADGKNLLRITQDMGDNEDPAWSPDGQYLLFSSTREGRSELWLATADGRHQLAVTRSGGWSQPAFAPGAGR